MFHTLLALGGAVDSFSRELRIIHHFRALEIIDQLVVEFPYEPDYRDALACQLQMVSGNYSNDHGDFDMAQKLASRCVEVATKLATEYPDRPSYLKHIISGSSALAKDSESRGELKDAQEIIESVIKVSQKLCERQPEVPDNRELQALVWARAGLMAVRNDNLPLAEEYQQRATKIIEQLVSEYPDNDVFIDTSFYIRRWYQNYLAGKFTDR